VAKSITVSVSPDVLLNTTVLSALLWSGQISEEEDRDDFIAVHRAMGHFGIHVDRYDGDHHFGPTLLLRSTRSPLQLTLPWHQVLAVVSDESGKMPIGFGENEKRQKLGTSGKQQS
jgi:hypothetical protein